MPSSPTPTWAPELLARAYYSDDSVVLIHGDCLTQTAWLDADVLCTDPPYGRSWRQGDTEAPHRASNAHAGILNDHSTETRDAALRMWGAAPAVVFGDLMLAPPSGTKLTAIYRKPPNAGARGAIAGVRRDAEALYFVGKWASGIGGRSSIFATTAPTVGGPSGVARRAGGHPHAKPLDVLAALIELCPPGVIADPFAGSGSTLVAAKQAGRKAIGVELDERYCEVAARRLSQGVLDFGEDAS